MGRDAVEALNPYLKLALERARAQLKPRTVRMSGIESGLMDGDATVETQ